MEEKVMYGNLGRGEEIERFQGRNLDLPLALSPTGLKSIVMLEKAWKLPRRPECSPLSTTVTQNNKQLSKNNFSIMTESW